MNTMSIEELKDLREAYANTRGVVTAIDELIALRELKGDQVPVAFTGSGSLAAIKGAHEGYIWGTPAEAHPVPLYDRPQKPVVLQPAPWGNSYASVALRTRDEEWCAAIEAAGCAVSDK